MDEDIQKKCRSGSRERLESLLRICDENAVPYFVLVTISRQNLESLKSTMSWLHAKRIAVIRSPFVPRGAAAKVPHLCFDRNDMGSKIHPALRDNPLSYVSYTPFFAAPDATHLTLGGRGLNLGNLGCQAGRTFIGINAEGDVAPCVHLLDSPVCCGNVREQPLSRILAESEIMRIRIENAKSLLVKTDKTNEGVARKCGFTSLTYFKEVTVVGSNGYRRDDLDTALAMLASGDVPWRDWLTHRYPLAAWRQAQTDAVMADSSNEPPLD